MPDRLPFDPVESTSRADLLLLVLPLLFLGMYGVVRVASNTWSIAVATASIVCCLLIADGLFWHSPHKR